MKILLTLLLLVSTSFAQFAQISRGPISGNCPGPEFGLDIVNNDLYICSSGTGIFQWVKISNGNIAQLPVGSVGQTLYNLDGTRAYGATSGVLFDGNGNLITIVSSNFSIDQAGSATFVKVTLPPDGTHPGKVGFVGNTTLPDLDDNTVYIVGPNVQGFTKFILFQMPSTTLPTATALCINASQILSTCSSVVASDGTCTCP